MLARFSITLHSFINGAHNLKEKNAFAPGGKISWNKTKHKRNSTLLLTNRDFHMYTKLYAIFFLPGKTFMTKDDLDKEGANLGVYFRIRNVVTSFQGTLKV